MRTMRAGFVTRRAGRVAIALLAGLLAGGWIGGGLVWMFNREAISMYRGSVRDPSLVKADELDLVPTDAVGFAHVRLVDMWRTEGMAEFRKLVEKAGPEALRALDEGFVPAPSSIDRMTVVLLREPKPAAPPKDAAPKKGKGGLAAPPGLRPPPKTPDGKLIELPAPPREPLPEPPILTGGTHPVILLAFSAPYEAAKFRAANMGGGQSRTANGKEYWVDSSGSTAAHFPSDRLLVVGPVAGMERFLQTPRTDGPLAGALKLAQGGTRHMVAAVNMKDPDTRKWVDGISEILPDDMVPMLKADSMAVTMVLGNGVKLEARGTYANDTDSEAAEKAVKAAAEAGRKALADPKKKMEAAVRGDGKPKPRPAGELPEAIGGLLGLGAINWLDEFLADPPVVRTGTELVATVNVGSLTDAMMRANALTIAMLVPAVDKVREAAAFTADQNNLKQIGLAMHNYEAVMGHLPAAAGTGNPNLNPKGNLSWRVHILPYIDQQQLYSEFKLDEPWDSPNNKKLIEKMPKVYASPAAPAPPGQTYYKVFVNDPSTPAPSHAMFHPKQGTRLSAIPDGTSNTIMVAEGGDPVVWTKPDDFVYDPKKPLPDLKLQGRGLINVLMGDGSVRRINLATTPEQTIRAMITRAGGEVVDHDHGEATVKDAAPFPFPEAPAPKPKGGLKAPPAPPPLPPKDTP